MKNITIAIDDETHRAARLHAAGLGTSISALVKSYLAGLATSAPADEAGVREMQSAFTLPAMSSAPASRSAAPWLVHDKPVWTRDGKPRQPGALRSATGVAEADDLAALPADMLAGLAAWDEDSFDPLP